MILASDVARSLSGPFVAACALLVVAGAGKVVRPAPARTAARAAGFGLPGFGIVAFGVLEMAAGATGIGFGRAAALVVGACYVVLTVVAVRLLRRAPATPCACLGSADAVVTRAHVAVNVAAAGVAVVAATGGPPLAHLTDEWFAGALFAVLVACCVKLAMLVLDDLAELATATATKEGTT